MYGNDFLKNMLKSMIKSGRLPNVFIIYGEKGMGKKTAALYMAETILCDKGGTEPCGECRSCRNAQKRIHPDIIYPQQSGKLMTYTIDTCREVYMDSIIAPNNGEKKVYIFSDADNIRIPAQNSLLKLIEEPPEFTYFIFTASSKDVFLPTILSRAVSIGVTQCSESECLQALMEKGYSMEQSESVVNIFPGNIGMCLSCLEDDNLKIIAQLTKKAADSIIKRDEYGLLTVFSSDVMKDRNNAAIFLGMLDKVIRDGAVMQLASESKCIGCCPDEAVQLGKRISVSTAAKIHYALEKAAEDYRANVNQILILSGLCGEIAGS